MPQNKNMVSIAVVLNEVTFPRENWRFELDRNKLESEVAHLNEQLQLLGVEVSFLYDSERTIEANGYGDILNAVRIRSSRPGLGNLCLGHVIGASENLDLIEDVCRGVRRVAFAPETVEPEGSDKVVCHNCGCGC